MHNDQIQRPALPLFVLLALASALGVVVAVVLASLAMLLAAPAYAAEGTLLLERHGSLARAELLYAESETFRDGHTRVVETYHNSFDEPLGSVYVFRVPESAVVERLQFSQDDGAQARPAVLIRRDAGAVLERAGELGAGETLRVELEYRPRGAPRALSF